MGKPFILSILLLLVTDVPSVPSLLQNLIFFVWLTENILTNLLLPQSSGNWCISATCSYLASSWPKKSNRAWGGSDCFSLPISAAVLLPLINKLRKTYSWAQSNSTSLYWSIVLCFKIKACVRYFSFFHQMIASK